jgi:predicted porin
LDKHIQQDGLETDAGEVDLDYNITDKWILSSGLRYDNREDNSPIIPQTQEVGERTDAIVKMKYDSLARWTTYGFAQDTVNTTGNRDENGRVGVGGDWRVTERLNLVGEVSEGDLGPAGKIGTEYLFSDKTTLYQNYTLENERSDDGFLARKGNMTSGFQTRYSDSMSVFLEERYSHGDIPTGLTHSTGVDLIVTERLNLGANFDFGSLKDPQTAAEIDRKTIGGRIGYGFDHVKLASGLEYRVDENEQPDTSFTKRTTWLFKNSLKYQMSPDWRLLGKFNYSLSESSLGDFYDGDYTEAVLGFGYRPIYHDRLNALLKYTYFYNLPPVDQMTGGDTSAGFIQRSHIGALDVMYDLTSRWAVGGKYAYRHGEVATDREQPDYFASRAHLYVLRADWHFIHRWDVLVEGRLLDLPDAQDRRNGALLGLYRHVGNHLKFGVGYNFSDFSDDLTQLDYRHQGVFINIVGKY